MNSLSYYKNETCDQIVKPTDHKTQLLFIKPNFGPITGHFWVRLISCGLKLESIKKIFLNGIECTLIDVFKNDTILCQANPCISLTCFGRHQIHLYDDQDQLIPTSGLAFEYISDQQISQLSEMYSLDQFMLVQKINLEIDFDYQPNSSQTIFKYQVKLIGLPESKLNLIRIERTADNYPRVILNLSCDFENELSNYVSDVSKFSMDYNFESYEKDRTAVMVSFVPFQANLTHLCYFPIESLHNQIQSSIDNCKYTFVDQNKPDPRSCLSNFKKIDYVYLPKPYDGKLFAHLNYRVSSLYMFHDSFYIQDTMALVGTEDGLIIKIWYTGILNQAKYSDYLIERHPKVVNDSGKERLVFTSGSKSIIYRHHSCSIYKNCFNCIFSQDPLGCRWCQGVCSKRCKGTKQCNIKIHSIVPHYGPVQGGTLIKINGSNFSQILAQSHSSNVIISNTPCDVQEWQDTLITCLTRMVNSPTVGQVKLSVQRHKLRPNDDYREGTLFSESSEVKIIETEESDETIFYYVIPKFLSIRPNKGLSYKNSNIIISGKYLNIGTNRTIIVKNLICAQEESDSLHDISCTTNEYANVSESKEGPVVMYIDNAKLTFQNITFCFAPFLSRKLDQSADILLPPSIYRSFTHVNYSEGDYEYTYDVKIYKYDVEIMAILTRYTISHFDYEIKVWLSCTSHSELIPVDISIGILDEELAYSSEVTIGSSAVFIYYLKNDTHESFVCYYPISTINKKINKVIKDCYSDSAKPVASKLALGLIQFKHCDVNCIRVISEYKMGDLVLRNQFAGSLFFEHAKTFTKIHVFSTLIHNHTLAIIGTSDGYIMKLIYRTLLSVKKYSNQPIPKYLTINRKKKILLFNNEPNRLNPIIYPYDSCSIYTTCAQCTSALDPIGCSWCNNTCKSGCKERGEPCNLAIVNFEPTFGPLKGGTQIYINVSNLFYIDDRVWYVYVKVAGSACSFVNWRDFLIICKTNLVKQVKSGLIEIIVDVKYEGIYAKYPQFLTPSPIILQSILEFHYVQPVLESVNPTVIRILKRQRIKLSGKYLNIGSIRRINVAALSCIEQETNDLNKLMCDLEPAFLYHKPKPVQLTLTIDNEKLFFNVSVTYTANLNDNEIPKVDCLMNETSINETTYITGLVQKGTTIVLDKSITFLGKNVISNKFYLIKVKTKCKPNLTINTDAFNCDPHPPLAVNCSLPIPPEQCLPLVKPIESELTLVDSCSTVNSSTFKLVYYPNPMIYKFDTNNNSLIIDKDEVKVKLKGQWLNANLDLQAFLVSEINGRWLPCIQFEQLDKQTVSCSVHHDGQIRLDDQWQVEVKVGKEDYRLGKVHMIPGPKWINIKMDHIFKTGAVFLMIIIFIPILYWSMRNIKRHLNLDYSLDTNDTSKRSKLIQTNSSFLKKDMIDLILFLKI